MTFRDCRKNNDPLAKGCISIPNYQPYSSSVAIGKCSTKQNHTSYTAQIYQLFEPLSCSHLLTSSESLIEFQSAAEKHGWRQKVVLRPTTNFRISARAKPNYNYFALAYLALSASGSQRQCAGSKLGNFIYYRPCLRSQLASEPQKRSKAYKQSTDECTPITPVLTTLYTMQDYR